MTSKLIASYLVGFVILPSVVLSASLDIPTGPASMCDPQAFPLCSCSEEIIFCSFYKNLTMRQMTFSGDNIPSNMTRVIIWGIQSSLEVPSTVVIEKEQRKPIRLEQLVLLQLSELYIIGSLAKVDCLNLLLVNQVLECECGVLKENADVVTVDDANIYPGLGANALLTVEYTRYFRDFCLVRKAVRELKANDCLVNSTLNFDRFF